VCSFPAQPLPITPFADNSFAGEKYLKTVQKKIKSKISNMGGVRVSFEPLMNAKLEAYFSKCDETACETLERIWKFGNFRKIVKGLDV